MNWGTAGDGSTRPRLDPADHAQPDHHRASRVPEAVQNIATPAIVKSTMGAYLPTVTYTDAAQFQHTGCNAGTR